MTNTSVLQILQDMHQVKAPSEVFQIPGGCPVKVSSAGGAGGVSFREALEQMSLSAIMASMMNENHEQDHQADEHKHNETHKHKQTTPIPTSSSSSNTTTTHSLSESLKTGTASSHQAAENVHFVQNFIQGKIDRNLYATMVGMLYHVYVTLEDCLDQHAPHYFPSCHFPQELARTLSLTHDIDFWWGTTTTTTTARPPPISPATRDYRDRLRHVAQHDPLLLLAHAYTRYLGDLSGGKVLARVAKRALTLEQDGLDFYHFEHIASIKLFKDKYRQALDALPLTEEQIQRVVAEANVAFCLNMRLFEELDVQANVPGARVRPLEDVFRVAEQSVVAEKEECPFLKSKKKTTTATSSRCPWPFVFAHDPVQGMKDWQTWLVLGFILCWIWSMLQSNFGKADYSSV